MRMMFFWEKLLGEVLTDGVHPFHGTGSFLLCGEETALADKGLGVDGDAVCGEGLAKLLGRTLAAVTVACPPAVPILISGEVIDESAIELFNYYGINECTVVK